MLDDRAAVETGAAIYGIRQACDLIAIGKRGSGMIRDWLFGRVTRHVLALSSADVLAVEASQGSDP